MDDDETFRSFYDHNDAVTMLTRNKVDVSVDDFDHIFLESENM